MGGTMSIHEGGDGRVLVFETPGYRSAGREPRTRVVYRGRAVKTGVDLRNHGYRPGETGRGVGTTVDSNYRKGGRV